MGTTFPETVASSIETHSRENFERLLTEMIGFPERRPEIAAEIEQCFGQEKAVMVLDMSGFSRTTQQHGIISFLLMIHQMQLICRPAVEHCRGKVIKSDADNLFCLFDTVAEAIEATRQISTRLATVNLVLPADRQLYVAFGIGFGKILNIGDADIFGDEVNLASKLGEDIARKEEVLLSASARASLGVDDLATKEEVISISGISLTYYGLQY